MRYFGQDGTPYLDQKEIDWKVLATAIRRGLETVPTPLPG
jgi:hypothetical protein